MNNIRKMFGLKKVIGQIGIEIEVEGSRLPSADSHYAFLDRYWRYERDGSLRGHSWEYVLKKPINIPSIDKALNALEKAYHKSRSNVSDSVRAGVHIHVNVQELSMKQVMTFATCYIVLEELLLTYCSKSRAGNHFCLRAGDAEHMVYLIHTIMNERSFHNLSTDQIRYASINFNALPKYGSIEFRALESTRELSKISTWAKMLHHIMEASQKYDNPVEVVASMSESGSEAFVMDLLGEYYELFVHKDEDNTAEIERMVYSGVRHAQDIAYGVDWKGVDKDIGFIPKKKKRGRRGPTFDPGVLTRYYSNEAEVRLTQPTEPDRPMTATEIRLRAEEMRRVEHNTPSPTRFNELFEAPIQAPDYRRVTNGE